MCGMFRQLHGNQLCRVPGSDRVTAKCNPPCPFPLCALSAGSQAALLAMVGAQWLPTAYCNSKLCQTVSGPDTDVDNIRMLSFTNIELKGTIPSALGGLTALQSL